MDNRKIADLLFPNLKWTTEEIEAKYKPRNLDKSQVVSRYAPSPTGYMHVGNFFQMFISYNLTRITNGKFFLRILFLTCANAGKMSFFWRTLRKTKMATSPSTAPMRQGPAWRIYRTIWTIWALCKCGAASGPFRSAQMTSMWRKTPWDYLNILRFPKCSRIILSLQISL